MLKNQIDREVLSDAWRKAFPRLVGDDDNGILTRLKCSQKAARHGTCTQVFINRIYDTRQSPATLPWVFCCYCLNYDPVHFETTGHNWCLKLHLNTVRLYFTEREKVVDLFKRELSKHTPKGFQYCPHPRQQVIEMQFTHAGSEHEVVDWIFPQLSILIKETYPILNRAIEIAEASVLQKQERRQLAASRPKVGARAANKDRPGNRQALNRSVPPKLRNAVIAKNKDGRCNICGEVCAPEDIHIDHIESVANGGLTELANLWVTCSRCNLAKGSGRPRSPVAHVPAKVRKRKIG